MNESPPGQRPRRPRKDRLIELIALLRDGRLHRAEDLARKLGVSVRTLYRDMDTLAASGVPVRGTRGEGYRMTAPVTLPPLNLTMEELEALHLGIAVMTEATDPALKAAARALARKLDEALPEDRVSPTTGWGLAVYPFADPAAGIRHMPAIRTAIRRRRKLKLHYLDARGDEVASTIRPLRLDYWGRVWTCTGWCETRRGFRRFRLDQITDLVETATPFAKESGKELRDFNKLSGNPYPLS